MDNKGVSVIELLLAVVLAASIAAMIGLLFPRLSRSRVQNEQRAKATVLATSKFEDIQKTPYGLVGLTQSAYFLSTTGPDPCDCVTEANNVGNIPANGTLLNNVPAGDATNQGGVTYTRSVCINQEAAPPGASGPDWISMCPPNINPSWSETDLKSVHVRVSWVGVGNVNNTVDVEGVVYQ